MSVRAVSFACISIIAAALTACGHDGGQKRALPSYANPAVVARGAQVYASQCAACHGKSGVSGPVGPSLKNERSRRTYGQIRAFVLDPQPPMPKLYPGMLSKRDADDVSAYVESL